MKVNKVFSIVLRKRFRFLVILFLVVISSSFLYYHLNSNKNLHQSYQVTTGDLSSSVIASGNVQPAELVEVYASTTGVIGQLLVENGQTVKAGDPLFSVISTATPAEKAAAKASYMAAIASRQQAEQTKLLNQSKLEQARQAIIDAQSAVDSMEDKVAASQSNPNTGDAYTQLEKESIYSLLTSARQSFSNAEQKYLDDNTAIAAKSQDQTAKQLALEATEDQVVVAAVSGMVANIGADQGDQVEVSTILGSKPVMSLTNFDSYTILIKVKEGDIYQIQKDQAAEVTFEALDSQTLPAQVSRIDSLGEADSGVVTYNVYLQLLQSDSRLRAGMTAAVAIMTETSSNTLIIPNDYLDRKDEQVVVYKQTPSQVVTQKVTIGIKSTSMSEVLEGLSSGDIIVKMVTP